MSCLEADDEQDLPLPVKAEEEEEDKVTFGSEEDVAEKWALVSNRPRLYVSMRESILSLGEAVVKAMTLLKCSSTTHDWSVMPTLQWGFQPKTTQWDWHTSLLLKLHYLWM